MPQVELDHKRSKKPATVAVGALVVVVLVAAGVLYLRWAMGADQRYKTAVADATKQVQYLDYNGAISTYMAYLKTFPSKEDKYKIEIQVGQVYAQEEHWKESLVWYQKAEKDGTSMDIWVKPGIGAAALQLGDKQLSISSYRAAIELLKKSDYVSAHDVITEYNAAITSQGGTASE